MVKDYSVAIKSISNKLGTLHSFDFVFTSEEFISIYEEPNTYIDSCIVFLSNEHSRNEKIVALLSMNRLDLSSYIVFADKSGYLFAEGKIDEVVMNYIIGFSFKHKPLLVENYENNEVKDVLQRIKNTMNASSQLKDEINSILSGEVSRKLRVFRENAGY